MKWKSVISAWGDFMSLWCPCEPGKGGKWWSWRIVTDRRRRASCDFIHAWRWWNARLHLWKFAAWRFICKGLTVVYCLSVCSEYASLNSFNSGETDVYHSSWSHIHTVIKLARQSLFWWRKKIQLPARPASWAPLCPPYWDTEWERCSELVT